jgi:hypothetical protein
MKQYFLGERNGTSGEFLSKEILQNDSALKKNSITSFFRSLPIKEGKLRKELKLVIWMIDSDIPWNTLEVYSHNTCLFH